MITISHSGRCSTFSWPYQAKVMNTLETSSIATGVTADQLSDIGTADQLPRSGPDTGPSDTL
jgi:hypothetical protein